jgi:hypothetical protein
MENNKGKTKRSEKKGERIEVKERRGTYRSEKKERGNKKKQKIVKKK